MLNYIEGSLSQQGQLWGEIFATEDVLLHWGERTVLPVESGEKQQAEGIFSAVAEGLLFSRGLATEEKAEVFSGAVGASSGGASSGGASSVGASLVKADRGIEKIGLESSAVAEVEHDWSVTGSAGESFGQILAKNLEQSQGRNLEQSQGRNLDSLVAQLGQSEDVLGQEYLALLSGEQAGESLAEGGLASQLLRTAYAVAEMERQVFEMKRGTDLVDTADGVAVLAELAGNGKGRLVAEGSVGAMSAEMTQVMTSVGELGSGLRAKEQVLPEVALETGLEMDAGTVLGDGTADTGHQWQSRNQVVDLGDGRSMVGGFVLSGQDAVESIALLAQLEELQRQSRGGQAQAGSNALVGLSGADKVSLGGQAELGTGVKDIDKAIARDARRYDGLI